MYDVEVSKGSLIAMCCILVFFSLMTAVPFFWLKNVMVSWNCEAPNSKVLG